jgi:hypothetical protein
MKRKKTKDIITISVDSDMNDIMKENFANKSQYIEWLIYQDLKKNMSDDDRIEKIIL